MTLFMLEVIVVGCIYPMQRYFASHKSSGDSSDDSCRDDDYKKVADTPVDPEAKFLQNAALDEANLPQQASPSYGIATPG